MTRLGSDKRYESKIMSGDQPFTAMRFPFWNMRPETEFHYQTEDRGSAESERRENPSNKLGISILNQFTFPFFAVYHQVQYNPNVHFPRWVAGGHIGLSWVHLVIREGNTPPYFPSFPYQAPFAPNSHIYYPLCSGKPDKYSQYAMYVTLEVCGPSWLVINDNGHQFASTTYEA